MVKAHIENGHFLEHSNLGRQATGEIIIHENDLIECFTHIPNTCWNATTKIIVGKNKNRNGRVSKIRWDPKLESIIV